MARIAWRFIEGSVGSECQIYEFSATLKLQNCYPLLHGTLHVQGDHVPGGRPISNLNCELRGYLRGGRAEEAYDRPRAKIFKQIFYGSGASLYKGVKKSGFTTALFVRGAVRIA